MNRTLAVSVIFIIFAASNFKFSSIMKNFSQPPVTLRELAKAVNGVCTILNVKPTYSLDEVRMSELFKTVEHLESSNGIDLPKLKGLSECAKRFQSLVEELMANGKLTQDQLNAL